MSKLLDVFEPGEQFGTQPSEVDLMRGGRVRIWRIDRDGTPFEVTKESNNG